MQFFASELFEAKKNGEIILALEDSSYLGFVYTKDVVSKNEKLHNIVAKFLDTSNFTCKDFADVLHVNSLLFEDEYVEIIKSKLKHSFEKFNAGFCFGNDISRKMYCNKKINNLFNVIGLNRVKLESALLPNGYDIFTYSPEVAMKMAGKILFDALDSGCAFLIVNDIRTFTFFDSYQKKIAKTISRDLSLPILTLAQVVLMAIGQTDKKVLGFNKHDIKPTLLS
ncbi:MAG: hypothetical protein ACK5LP_09160 [Campylobacteraceae bacterium]